MVFCCVQGCESNLYTERSRHKKITYHSFPVNSERKLEWLRLINRTDWNPPPSAKVCSAHFASDQFNRTYASGLIKLRETASPTLKLPSQDCVIKPKRQFMKSNTCTNSSIVELKQEPLEYQPTLDTEETEYEDCETNECEPECIIKCEGILEGGNQNIGPQTLPGEKWLLEQRGKLSNNVGYNRSIFKTLETKRKHPDWFFNSLYKNNKKCDFNGEKAVESEPVKAQDNQFQIAKNMGWILAKTEDENLELIPVMGVPETDTGVNLSNTTISTLSFVSDVQEKQSYINQAEDRESECKRLRSMLETCQEKLVNKRKDWRKLQNAYRKLKRNHSKMRAILLEKKLKLEAMGKKNSFTQTENKRNFSNLSASEMREFSLNLYRISPEAYTLVEECFSALPDSKTVSEWSTVLDATEQLSCIGYNTVPEDRLWIQKDVPDVEHCQVLEEIVYDSVISFRKQSLNSINDMSMEEESNNNMPTGGILDLSHKACTQAILEEPSVLSDHSSAERVKVIPNYPSQLPQVVTPSPEKHFDVGDHFDPDDYLHEKCFDHNYSVETVCKRQCKNLSSSEDS